MTIAVLTARLSPAARIPNKVLAPICGRPILDWIYDRLAKSKVNRIVLAVPEGKQHHPLLDWAHAKKCPRVYVTTGKEDDVLDRVTQAGWENGARKVIRITGDLPFLSYEGIDALCDGLGPDVDYVNNVYGASPWLDGTNAEIAWFDAVSRANRLTPFEAGQQTRPTIRIDGTWRSHCFYWMANSPDFKQKFLEGPDISDIAHVPLMVDEPKDLLVAELLMEKVIASGDDSYAGLLEIVRREKTAIEQLRAG